MLDRALTSLVEKVTKRLEARFEALDRRLDRRLREIERVERKQLDELRTIARALAPAPDIDPADELGRRGD